MTDILLHFNGPFTFTGDDTSVFHSPFAESEGIYLWTFRQRKDDTHCIHYVGETTSFGDRHREHLTHIQDLYYGIFSSNKAQDGVCELLWPGLWRDETLEPYETIDDDVTRYVAHVNIFVAEVKTDRGLRRHIEGCIGWNLRNNHPEHKVLYPDDNRVGTKPGEKNRGQLLVTSSERIRGLDSEIAY